VQDALMDLDLGHGGVRTVPSALYIPDRRRPCRREAAVRLSSFCCRLLFGLRATAASSYAGESAR
jgi:hypothetical protein